MNINTIKCNIHNKFDIEVIDGKTGEIKEKAEAYNMVLDNLWHYIIETTTAFGTAIQYGSGTGIISASDTSLFNRVNGINVTQDSLDCDYVNKVIARRCHINLGLTTSVGVNITEVGLAAGTGNGTLTTHAMLQDMNGNPISIAKTEFDIINIYATIYCHWTLTDPDTTVLHPFSGLQNGLTGASNPFGSFTAGVTRRYYNAGQNEKTWTKTSYSLTNKTITYTMPRYTQAEGNCQGIEWILGTGNFDGVGLRKGQNTWSAFTISNEAVGTGDGIQTKFKTKFSFPYNATIYINGVAVSSSDVTVLRKSVYSDDFISLDVSSSIGNLIQMPVFSTSGTDYILYNPDCATNNFKEVRFQGSYWYDYTSVVLYGSDDLTNWELLYNGNSFFVVPEGKQNYMFYKFEHYNTRYPGNMGLYIFDYDGYNIIFNIPPADGDVITIDYTTDCIPKDSDHVLDATITFQFGDYTPSP